MSRENLCCEQLPVLLPYICLSAFQGLCTHIFRATCRIWRNMLGVNDTVLGDLYNSFLLLGSSSLILSCSSPSPSCLTLPPYFPSQSPLIFFPSRTVPDSLYEYCRVSLKSTDMGAVGLRRRATATPLPHPEQLLILCNRIISAKVAALFRSQDHSKQTRRASCAETEMQRGAKDMQQKAVRQFGPDISNRSDGLSDTCGCIDPASPRLNPTCVTILPFPRHSQTAFTVLGLCTWQTLFNRHRFCFNTGREKGGGTCLRTWCIFFLWCSAWENNIYVIKGTCLKDNHNPPAHPPPHTMLFWHDISDERWLQLIAAHPRILTTFTSKPQQSQALSTGKEQRLITISLYISLYITSKHVIAGSAHDRYLLETLIRTLLFGFPGTKCGDDAMLGKHWISFWSTI